MKKQIKELLKSFLPSSIIKCREKQWIKHKIKEWETIGSPIPPPDLVKQYIISAYQEAYNCKIFIETGTYKGSMVYAQKNRFKKIISIELSQELYENAKIRFKDDDHITILQGDSGKVLPNIMINIKEPVLFWLDSHYSGGITALGDSVCPIIEEIDAIFSFSHQNHILLIDDARDFNGTNDYPTIEELVKHVLSKNKDYKFEVKDDIIRFLI
jgi:hypothetical protein